MLRAALRLLQLQNRDTPGGYLLLLFDTEIVTTSPEHTEKIITYNYAFVKTKTLPSFPLPSRKS
jgi:hypothetical protein